jgi:hypothetical protein
VDSAPQDEHVHAPVDTAQAPLAIFFTREDIPSSFESTQDTAHGSVDTLPSAPTDLRCRSAALPAPNIAGALLTAGDAESLDSSISPCAGVIKACTQASGAVNTAHGISVGRSTALGEVLDDFSLADTFIAQPPPLVSVSSAERAEATAPPGHQTPTPSTTAISVSPKSPIPVAPCAHIAVTSPASSPIPHRCVHLHFLAACTLFWVAYLLWVATRCSGLVAYRSASVRPISRCVLFHQRPVDMYYLSSHSNGSASPFPSWNVTDAWGQDSQTGFAAPAGVRSREKTLKSS